MALARSASGPGGLSINTTSANSLFGSGTAPAGAMFGSTQGSKSLFGASTTTTASQTGGLFGTAPATTQAQTGGLFGSTTSTSQPQSGGLFGSAAASGGLFGSTATSQPQTGGLFGATTATSQPQTGGLFGSTTTTSQPQTSGLFGSSTATSQQQPGGLFGSTTTTSQPQTGGLFGSTQPSAGLFGTTNTSQQAQGGANTLNQNQSGTSLFGGLGTTQNQQPQQGSMFSSLNQSQAPSGSIGFGAGGSTFGGGLTMGQSKTPQPQTIPGVKIDVANLRGTTRFNDLHEELQKQIEHMDNVIQGQIKLKNDCSAIMAPHDSQLATVPSDVEFLRRKLVGLESSMAADAESISHVREFIKADAENAKLSFRAIDNLKLPPQFHVSGVWPTKPPSTDSRAQNGSESDVYDIVGFFSSNADELSATLAKYRKHIGEIEQHLRSVEESSAQQINSLIARRNDGSNGDEDEIRQLAYALTEFEQSILNVAGKVGGLRESIQKLQLGNFMGAANGRSTNGYRNSVY